MSVNSGFENLRSLNYLLIPYDFNPEDLICMDADGDGPQENRGQYNSMDWIL